MCLIKTSYINLPRDNRPSLIWPVLLALSLIEDIVTHFFIFNDRIFRSGLSTLYSSNCFVFIDDVLYFYSIYSIFHTDNA